MIATYLSVGFRRLLAVAVLSIGGILFQTSAFAAPSCDFLAGQATQAMEFYGYILDQCIATGSGLEQCMAETELQRIQLEDLMMAALKCGQ